MSVPASRRFMSNFRSSEVDWRAIIPSSLRREKGDCFLVHEVSAESFASFSEYSQNYHLIFRYYPDQSLLLIKYPHVVHEKVSFYFSSKMMLYNLQLSGNPLSPIGMHGTTHFSLRNGTICSPNCSFRSEFPPRRSNNCVVEIANSEGLASLAQSLRDYITFTDDILLAIGVKIWRNIEFGGAELLFIMYLRQLGTSRPILHSPSFISFGNIGLAENHQNQALNAIPGLSELEFKGVGFGQEDCDQPNHPLYIIHLPSHLLLCTDNLGQQLPPNVIISENQSCMIDLYELQQQILTYLFEEE